jgi:hypothetical protein
MGELITVGAFTGPLEAHLAKGRLETEGIPAVVAHENHVWAAWMYSQALGGVKIQVARENAARARRVLASHVNGEYASALKQEFPDLRENACPACAAADFTSTVRLSAVLLIALTLGTVGIIFPLRRDRHRCRRCGARWRH